MPYTFPTSSVAEPFYNPYNPDYFSKVWRAKQTSPAKGLFEIFPSSSQLSVSESMYYYTNDTK